MKIYIDFSQYANELFTIVGIIIGWSLNVIRDEIREGLQSKRVRSLLSYEIDHNLNIINDIQNSLKNKQSDLENDTFKLSEQ